MTETAEQITAAHAYHGEGPVWHASWGGLRWVDMLAGDVLSLDATGEVHRMHVGAVAAALRPRRTGGMVVGIERGFALVDAAGAVRPLGELWADQTVRMNEGNCDPDGRFYCGSMREPVAEGAGSLYRLDADLTVSTVLTGVTISNGLAWSPDGGTAYYVDTPTHRIDAFEYDSRTGLSNRHPVVRIPEEQGDPDGLTVDADGYLWVALYRGGAVHRYAPDGRLDGVVEVPVSLVTACTFGGGDLFITTSRENLPEGAEPAAGAVFRARPGVAGLPVLEFAG